MKIGKLKVVQIRKELQDRGLNTSGTRPALVKRLREALQHEQQQQGQQQQEQQQHQQQQEQPRKDDDSTGSKPPVPASDTGTKNHPSPAQSSTPGDVTLNASPRATSPPSATRVPAEQESSRAKNQPREPPAPAEANVDCRNDGHQRPDDVDGVRKDSETRVDAGADDGRLAVANGDLKRLNELALEERMKKRMQRFGAVEKPPPKSNKPLPESTKTVKPKAPCDLSKINDELKRRRAIKFGTAFDDSRLSKEERERRLKRQRRFQSTDSGTAV